MTLRDINWHKVGVIGVLRLLTGIAQFAVILLITSALTLQDVGSYTLFTIFLNYTAQIAGFSVYTYFSRILATASRGEVGTILYQVWAALALCAGSTILGTLILIWCGVIEVGHLYLFLFLVLISVFNVQHENVLIAVGNPFLAAITLFVKNIWAYGLFAGYYLGGFEVSLNIIYFSWALSESFAASTILIYLFLNGMLPTVVTPIDFALIRRALVASSKYTALSLLLVLTITVQRVVLSLDDGEKYVGVFHFFYVISVFGPNLVEAAIYAVLLPKLIRASASAGYALRPPSLQVMALMLITSAVGLSVLYLMLPSALAFLGKPELVVHMKVAWATMAFALLYTTSRGFHYQLYAAGADNWILGSYILSALVGCSTSYFLTLQYGLTGASISLVLTGLTMAAVLSSPFVLSLKPSLTRRTVDG